MSAFDIGIGMIFAREFLEGAVIITQYRTLVHNSSLTEDEKYRSKKIIWKWAGGASFLAILIILIVGIALNVAGNELNKDTTRVIEGISKIVAAICIGQLTIKIPKWLGLYGSKHKDDALEILEPKKLAFNVGWNIWREIAEIGVFLIPYFLKGAITAVPLSAFVGIFIALFLGFLLHLANGKMNKKPLAIFMAVLTGWLAIGLFTGGCHEFEEVYGETEDVYEFKGTFWDHHIFPMAIAKPFGYSQSPSVLQVSSFWGFTVLLSLAHLVKYYRFRHKSTRILVVEMDDDINAATDDLKKI